MVRLPKKLNLYEETSLNFINLRLQSIGSSSGEPNHYHRLRMGAQSVSRHWQTIANDVLWKMVRLLHYREG